MNVHQMEEMDHVTKIVPTLLDHFTAVVNLGTLSLAISATVRFQIITCYM